MEESRGMVDIFTRFLYNTVIEKRKKNAGVAGYAEAFRPVQSDSQTSEWYSYFENDVLERV